MSTHRRQIFVDAPLEEVWALVGDPGRYPEWWPRVIEVDGERIDEGANYATLVRTPFGGTRSDWLIDRVDDPREIGMSCTLTGTRAHWLLTAASGGTFVELELGMEPIRRRDRAFDALLGRAYFRAWAERSLAGLRDASETAEP